MFRRIMRLCSFGLIGRSPKNELRRQQALALRDERRRARQA